MAVSNEVLATQAWHQMIGKINKRSKDPSTQRMAIGHKMKRRLSLQHNFNENSKSLLNNQRNPKGRTHISKLYCKQEKDKYINNKRLVNPNIYFIPLVDLPQLLNADQAFSYAVWHWLWKLLAQKRRFGPAAGNHWSWQ